MKEVFLNNFVNFSKMLGIWIAFCIFLFIVVEFLPDFAVAILSVFAYIIFYLFYLAFIAQSRATIDTKRIGVMASLKEVYEDFMTRKAFDLLEIIPIALVLFLIIFFPSSIFAIPIAFIMALATIIFLCYTVLAQPVMVIKKTPMFTAIKKSINLITGYFTFVFGLMMAFILCSLIIYLLFSYIKVSAFAHHVLTSSVIGVEIMFFAIMLAVIYTNLEVAWSTGFKTYEQGSVLSNELEETNHEFTEYFNKIPEVEI
ncbi:MAG: hypothetical protein IKP23_03440, partial [Elusimicrobiaceae bacterium]|nr:hypothetical protein [Elusimicrobiaceae bacterium]